MVTIVRDLDGNLENEEGLGSLEDYLGETTIFSYILSKRSIKPLIDAYRK